MKENINNLQRSKKVRKILIEKNVSEDSMATQSRYSISKCCATSAATLGYVAKPV